MNAKWESEQNPTLSKAVKGLMSGFDGGPFEQWLALFYITLLHQNQSDIYTWLLFYLIHLEIEQHVHMSWYRIMRFKKKKKKAQTQRKTIWHDITATGRTVVKTCSIDPICMFN